MHIAVDVYYKEEVSITSAVVFRRWSDAGAEDQITSVTNGVQPYVPGQFYKRELAPILTLLNQLKYELETIVIDGFVWLDDAQTPGLGAYLYGSLNGKVPIVGVAKNRFRDSAAAVKVLRGQSERPLFVTAAGLAASDAADRVRQMHGEFRMPTLLKCADRLGRDHADSLQSES